MLKFLCFLLLGIAYGSYRDEATTRLRLTPAGFNMDKYYIQEYMEKTILSKPLPSFTATLDDEYTVKSDQGRFLDFMPSKDSKWIFEAPNGVCRNIKGGTVTFGGKWNFNREDMEDTLMGDYELTLADIETTFKLSLHRSKNGTLQVNTDECDFRGYKMTNANVTSDMNMSLTYQIKIVEGLQKGFGARLLKLYCPLMSKIFSECSNRFFGHFPLRYTKEEDKNLEIGYELLEPMTGDYGLDIFGRHHIYYKKVEMKIPNMYQLPKLPEGSNEYMMLLQGTDDVLNDKFYADFKLGLLEKTITKSDLGKKGHLLATTCKAACVGRFAKTLAEKFPNMYVHLKLSASKPITACMTPTGISMDGEASVGVYIMMPSGEEKMLMKGMIYANGTIFEPKITERKLVAKFIVATFDIVDVKSFLKDLQGNKLTKLLELVMKKGDAYLEKLLNDRLAEGIPLPLSKGLGLRGDPVFWFQDHAGTIGFNFKMDN